MTKIALFLLLALGLTVACKKKEGTAAMLSGTGTKVWKIAKQTDASGDREKLGTDDKDDRLTFNADGSFAMSTGMVNLNGAWNYNTAAKTLTLSAAGAGPSRQFTVAELTDDKVVLKAADGSNMTLEDAE